MSAYQQPQRRSEALAATECHRLLGSATLGRVGWNAADGPQILPVAYVVHDGIILFRSTPYGALAELRRQQPVAFEVDDVDADTRTGWSVLVRGRTRPTGNLGELTDLWAGQGPVPWAPGVRNLVLAITPDQITGRMIA